jgi:hypothetical protein
MVRREMRRKSTESVGCMIRYAVYFFGMRKKKEWRCKGVRAGGMVMENKALTEDELLRWRQHV